MFFCILDKEYPREIFHTCPHLYGIGLRNERFNTGLFWCEIFRAWFAGGVILVFSYYGCDGLATYQSGVNGQMWASGQLVYACVIINANFYVLQASHNHSFLSLTFLFLSILSFFLFFYLENLLPLF